MVSMEVGSLSLIHKHLMMPCNDLRKGDCCGRLDAISDGYYCKICDFFIHKKCGDETSQYIEHPSHPGHTLEFSDLSFGEICSLCGRHMGKFGYRCKCCKGFRSFKIDILCARNPPPEIIDVLEMHPHKLTLLKKLIKFDCDAKCGKIGLEFPYKCHECNLFFHVDCVWHPSMVKHAIEVNHSNHSLHSLMLFMGPTPEYSDGKCLLCGRKIEDRLYYHCSFCKFTLDMRCVLNPPPQFLVDLKTHDHKLTLLPRLGSFACNVCGLDGDRSPYLCIECGFMIHGDCVNLPRVININRHDHRLTRTSLLGIVNSMCGVCHQRVDWNFGGYLCQKCDDYVVHAKCAIREDVWNGKELEEVPEEIEDINPYVVIDDHTIQHFSHIEHHLKLHDNGVFCEENRRCNACSYPILPQSFYGCINCDYILHQTCAEFPKKKRHVTHNEQLTLITSDGRMRCDVCHRVSSGFKYEHGDMTICLLCASVSEPFFHQSHPHHPLYYSKQQGKCNGYNEWGSPVLRCIQKGCVFRLDFESATIPLVIKHRVEDHPLSLYFGEKASGKYWCDICESEANPETWFYTCKDHRACLHPKCVFGDLFGLMPTTTITMYGMSCEVVLNKNMTRPFCSQCMLHCMYPILLKSLGNSHMYICSKVCRFGMYQNEWKKACESRQRDSFS